MDKVSTRPQVGATPATSCSPRLAPVGSASSAPAIEFDSSAMDVITSRTEYIRGLASCAVCLTAVEAAGESYAGHELISIALPSLNYVIMEMADQIAEAGDRLWEQYRQAAAITNCEVQS